MKRKTEVIVSTRHGQNLVWTEGLIAIEDLFRESIIDLHSIFTLTQVKQIAPGTKYLALC